MRDLITYCENTEALLAEVAASMPDRVIRDMDTDAPVGISIAKTPTVRKGLKTLAVVRVHADEVAGLKALKNIRVLADVEAGGDLLAAMSAADRAWYDSVHDQTPREMKDENGKVIGTYTPPELIGAFA